MRQYTFCKIRNKGCKEPANWYLLAEDADTVEKHWKSYAASYMREGVHQLFNERAGHYTNNFATAVSVYANVMHYPIMEALVHIENEALRGRFDMSLKGIIFYLDKGMTCLVDSPTIEIVETIIKDTLVFLDEERLEIIQINLTLL